MKQNTRQVLMTAARSASNLGAAMGLEPLEDRRLMTATPAGPIAFGAGGVLTLSGNMAGGNQLRVDLGGFGQNKVLQADVNGTFQSFAAASVKQIHITGGTGDDYVYVDPRVGTPTSIVTGSGNDVVSGGNGHDTIRTGAGNDTIYVRGTGNDVDAGTGTNSILSAQGDRAVDAGGNEVRLGGLANSFLYYRNRGAGSATTPTATRTPAPTTQPKATAPKPTAPKPTGTTAPTTPTTPKASTPTPPKATGTPTPVATPAPIATPVAQPVAAPVAQPVAQPVASPVQPAVVVAGGTPAADLAALSAPINPGGTTADGKPVAVLDLMPGVRQTGLVVNVDGLNSLVGTGTCVSTQYAWDFGDPSGAHDRMTGYNAGHVYDQPGTYTVTLTVTNQDGAVSVAQGQVAVAASTRQQVFVDSVNGSDANAGTTASAPLKTAAAAFAKLGDNTEVLLKAGESFPLAAGISINSSNVLIGRYGTGADPVLMRVAGNTGQAFQTFNGADGVTIEHVTFDSPNAVALSAAANKTGVCGVYVRGSNVTVRDCTFLNIDDAVNEAGNPGGTLVADNNAPLVNGLRGYMVWAQGDRGTIVGNTVANSTREHCVRLEYAAEETIEDNTLTNLGRAAAGDSGDIVKGCIEMQQGSYGWIAGNRVTGGDIRIGPRGATGIYGETATSSTDDCVIQDNQLTDTFLFVMPGSHHEMIQNNVILASGGEGAIDMNGTDADGRTSSDITIRNNTVVQSGIWGNFLRVQGWVSGVSLYNNLYVAPQLQVAYNGAAAVYVNGADLSCFSRISDNVWPSDTVPAGKWGAGGVMYVGTQYTADEFVTPASWLRYSEVSGDTLQDVTTADLAAGSYQLPAASSASGVTVGATLARAA